MNRPTVALTGGTGFIGGHLVPRLLDEGWSVRLLARRPPAHAAWLGRPIAVVPGSLEDAAALAHLATGADALVHLAGLVRARGRAAFFRVNAEAAGRVAAAARDAGVRRAVLVSTLAARELELSDYAASKAAGERAFLAAAPDGTLVLRPTAVYGPGDRATLAIFRAARLPVVPVVGSVRASLVHAADLAGAIAHALRNPQTGTVEIDDGGPGYSWPAIMAAAAGRPVRCLAVPPALFVTVGHGAGLARLWGATPFFGPGKARELVHRDWRPKGPALEGWRPVIALAEGFAATAAWYRASGWL
ncbi:MAG: NAD(P)-dependent oxidoreductase [Alphaproteobacteria bacterium]|nr:NAD(P)-dependent oxidoreductase [Alphaproteobacteria bacterium]